MKETDLAYFAGLLDGEGCIVIVAVKHSYGIEYKARILVVNTDRKMIEWCVEKFNGFLHQRRFRNKKWKDCFSWHRGIAKKDEEWLRSLLPYMITKKERVQLLIDYLQTVSEKRTKRNLPPEVFAERKRIKEKITELNDSGRSSGSDND